MDSEQHADNLLGNNSSGKQAVWTTAMSSFVLKFMANLVASGTRTSSGFKQVHLNSCAKALNERFWLQVTATQISNHLRKWKKIWARVDSLKSLHGAIWDEHTCTIVLDREHYTGHIKNHLSDADFLNTPIEHYHELATICGMASGVYARSTNEPLAMDVTENEIENEETSGASGPLATGVEETTISFTNTNGGGDRSGNLVPPKKPKGVGLEQHADNIGGKNGGGELVVWTNAMSSFVLQFLANLVAGGTRPSHVFKQVHLTSCGQALNEHFRVQLTAAQISNHLRKWKKIWAKVNMLKSLSGALWDENTCTIVLDHEHYTDHVKDHHNDADFLNTPIKHYREMATIFVKGKTSAIHAKGNSEPLARDVIENGVEHESNGGNDAIANNGVEEATMSFTNTNGGNIGGSSGSLPPPKKAKVNNDEGMLCTMTRMLDNLAKAIEKSSATHIDIPEDLWDNMIDLPGFEEAHLADRKSVV